MSKEKVKELIVCILAIAVLLLVVTTNVFAMDDDEDVFNALGGNANRYDNIFEEENENIKVNNTAKNNTVKNNTAKNNTAKNNTAKNNSKNNTSIPYTGVDHSVLAVIAVCGISAVYAYKKVRDYNNM